MNQPAAPELAHLARRWRRRTLARDVLVACGAVSLGVAFAVPWLRTVPWGAWAAVGAGALWARLRVSRPWAIGPERVAAHLDRSFPALEESAGLWLRGPGSLSVPERLQRQRLEDAWAVLLARGVRPLAAPAGFWRRPLTLAVTGMAALAIAAAWRTTHPRVALAAVGQSPAILPAVTPTPTPAPVLPRLADVGLTIVPPAYTGRPARTVHGLDAEVEEGAAVTWHVRLDDGPPVRDVRLVFGEGGNGGNGADELPLRAPGPDAGWEGERVVGVDSGLYRFSVRLPDGPERRLPETGALKVTRDAPPVVTVLQPARSRTELDPETATTVPVEIRVNDDHGVSAARLVATVAKGSGEGVKFRERTLEFDPPAPPPAPPGAPGPREIRFAMVLDLVALGMEPGDELYFHAEAEDNHPLAAHRARSETRFVVRRGPAADKPVSTGRGVMGVNLVPEYFRSQRQLIIDTEQLLAARPGLPEREFRRRAEDLGADQALLRLRYGQFVGEESEAGVNGGGGDHVEVNLNPLRPGVPAGVPADLVHQHDAGGGEPGGVVHDPRAGLRTTMRLRLEHADEARGRGGDAHDAPGTPDTGLPPAPGQIVAPYVDQHDSQEAATFFDPGTKATLRGVLAEMWTAEGFLRTARPEEALAPEHRALEALKELQQGERLYVQRVGFEPAPLRVAERRGRGDVTDVPERGLAAGPTTGADAAMAGVRGALAVLPGGDRVGRRLSPVERTALAAAAPALGEAAGRPGNGMFLEGLRALRRLETGDEAIRAGEMAAVRAALLGLLPPAEEHPQRPAEGAPGLRGSRAVDTTTTGGPPAP